MNATSVPVLFSLISVTFLGSWHCAVMCGPIAAALGKDRPLWAYHLGRGLSYLGLGALAGEVGRSVTHFEDPRLRIAGFLFLAALLLISTLSNIKVLKSIRCVSRRGDKSFAGQFLFGLANPLLPCGWLWGYVAAAAATANPWSGLLVLACLWLSSIPALSLAGAYFRTALPGLPAQKRRWTGWALAFAGMYSLVSHFFLHGL